MNVIEFLPAYATWEEWNGQLVHYFGDQSFSVLPEDQWQEVAQSVAVNPVFDKYSVPDPGAFINWQDWALSLTMAVNGDGA
jgi:hypothetical protein